MSVPLPLDGLVVLSLEQAVAAPFASRQLADLGARVIKVERHSGDFARDYDHAVAGYSSFFTWLNRGKESITLDLKSAQGRAFLEAALPRIDVVLQNLAPGAAERLSLGGPELTQRFPRLIHASISGYGRGGPYEQKKAYDLLVQCEAGLLSVTGSPDEPAKVGVSIADIAAGMYAYSGILAALLTRERFGSGQVLEVSMLEALGEWMMQPYLFARYSGVAPTPAGARHPTIAPYGPFDTSDGTVFIGIQNDREWQRFCSDVLNDPALAEDARYRGNANRVAQRDELSEAVSRRARALTSKELTALLDATGIANARLRSMHEFAQHPQLSARDRWGSVSTPVGDVTMLLPPVKVAGQTPRMRAVPALGEHTEAILTEFDVREGRS